MPSTPQSPGLTNASTSSETSTLSAPKPATTPAPTRYAVPVTRALLARSRSGLSPPLRTTRSSSTGTRGPPQTRQRNRNGPEGSASATDRQCGQRFFSPYAAPQFVQLSDPSASLFPQTRQV